MAYIQNIWYVAAHVEEIAEKPCGRSILDTPVVLYRTESGKAVALNDLCPHRFAPLHDGIVIGEAIRCPYHGLQFDETGQCVDMPLGDPAPPRACVTPYPLVERYGMLFIWMGDRDKADPGLIPDFSRFESKETGWFRFHLHAKANYQLLVDNLLDLTHPEFLHPMIGSKGWAKNTTYDIKQDGPRIDIHGKAVDVPTSKILDMSRPEMTGVGESNQMETWHAPSSILLDVDFITDGGKDLSRSGHFLTPETESSTHYFVIGGQSQDPSNEEMTAGMREGIKHVFATEDIPILEAQQKAIGDRDLLKMNPAILRSDQSAVLARRYVAAKIREEQADQ